MLSGNRVGRLGRAPSPLCQRRNFREKVKEVIGKDLNGFVLEDVAIDFLEQTDLEFMNVNDTNDAQGIEKIVRRDPAQYQWSYKRFRRLGENRPDIYRRQ